MILKLTEYSMKVLAGLTGIHYYSIILKNSLQKHQSSVSISVVIELLGRITKEVETWYVIYGQ